MYIYIYIYMSLVLTPSGSCQHFAHPPFPAYLFIGIVRTPLFRAPPHHYMFICPYLALFSKVFTFKVFVLI